MKDKKLCKTPFCKNKHKAGRRICSTCDKRIWRKRYPMKATYQTLRQNARRRGIIFTITFDDFKQFCVETKYMAGKGRSKQSFTVDRIIDDLGYARGNLQKLTKSDNSKKEQIRRKILVYDYRTGYAKVI